MCEVQSLSTTNQLKREQINRLHRNLGHMSATKIRQVLSIKPIMGLMPRDVQLLSKCNSCMMVKAKRKAHSGKAKRVPSYFGEQTTLDQCLYKHRRNKDT